MVSDCGNLLWHEGQHQRGPLFYLGLTVAGGWGPTQNDEIGLMVEWCLILKILTRYEQLHEGKKSKIPNHNGGYKCVALNGIFTPYYSIIITDIAIQVEAQFFRVYGTIINV